MNEPTDKEYIENPLNWVRFPFCPMKKRKSDGTMPDCGIVWSGRPTTVFEADLYSLPKTKEEFLALPKHEYDSIDAMLADGWEVD